jgi:hypothetical protein
MPGVAANPDQQPFPNISFKMLNDFVLHHFSSQVSLATVLMIIFSLTENTDLLNLHSRQKNPSIEGEQRNSSSGWMKALGRAIEQHLGEKTKSLLKHDERTEYQDRNSVADLLAVKLDQMATLLDLEPIYSQKSRKVQQKLLPVSHKEISAIHIICPVSMECRDPECQPRALWQDTRSRDVPHVTLIKGTIIYKDVHVLSGKCPQCKSRYYADHEAGNQVAGQLQVVYLNTAKYMKVGQSIWVDRAFGNAVTNGMYSFHASAAAYMGYWNNTFGHINSVTLSRRHIWQAFIQESIRTIAMEQNVNLKLNNMLPIDDVAREAFAMLGQNGVISASAGHSCSECTQPYRGPANEDGMDVDHADVKMHVVDGIVIGPTHCAYADCQNELLNARGGALCAIHERRLGNKCRIVTCQNARVNGTQACEEHQRAWQKHVHNRQPGTLAGVQRMLRRPGENLEWLPAPREHVDNPHDGPVLPDRQVKNYFSPNRFYCVETICAPCGIVVAWAKFAKSESPTNIMRFLGSVYTTQEDRPAYICIDKACLVLKHIVANDAYQDWFQTTRFIVDSYHYTNHKATDEICRMWCNPAPTDDSAPNLVVPAIDKYGNDVLKRAFNTQVSR